ncbi:MAG: hypothetical protein HOH19_00950 [Kordiimonadaceae bacterium]|nr:hypothetical protein [Kordiimonadaceae bacterium]
MANISHAHRFYASFSQVDMQSAKGTIEITHRIFTHDIEDLLRQYQGGNGELEDGVIESFLKEYIMQAFAIYDPTGAQIPLTWIAVEVTLNDIFVYQEAPLTKGQQSLVIVDRILMDLFDDQSNTVNLKLDGKVKSHTFHQDSEMYRIAFDGPSGPVTARN